MLPHLRRSSANNEATPVEHVGSLSQAERKREILLDKNDTVPRR